MSYRLKCPKCNYIHQSEVKISLEVRNGLFGWLRCVNCYTWEHLDKYIMIKNTASN
jgi:hypothetical protein